jgi:hypothetical protein
LIRRRLMVRHRAAAQPAARLVERGPPRGTGARDPAGRCRHPGAGRPLRRQRAASGARDRGGRYRDADAAPGVRRAAPPDPPTPDSHHLLRTVVRRRRGKRSATSSSSARFCQRKRRVRDGPGRRAVVHTCRTCRARYGRPRREPGGAAIAGAGADRLHRGRRWPADSRTRRRTGSVGRAGHRPGWPPRYHGRVPAGPDVGARDGKGSRRQAGD